MLEVNCQGEGVKASGFVSSPAAGRGNRAMQFFFVNGRTFRSATVQAALEQAYKNTLLTGRYPACALYLELSPGAVDVNVHPTKQEVKFSEEGRVFDAVYHGVLAALEKETGTAEIPLSRGTEKKLNFEGNRASRAAEAHGTQDAGRRSDPPLYSVEQPRFDMSPTAQRTPWTRFAVSVLRRCSSCPRRNCVRAKAKDIRRRPSRGSASK